MKKCDTVRQIDELGRLVLPIELRETMGWAEKTSVGFWMDDEKGEVLVKANENVCAFCGEIKNVKRFKKRYLCTLCHEELFSLYK